jgi:hypothetical protein
VISLEAMAPSSTSCMNIINSMLRFWHQHGASGIYGRCADCRCLSEFTRSDQRSL